MRKEEPIMTTKPKTKEREVDKIVLEFKEVRETKRTHLFEEEIGEQEWSDQTFAIGNLYVKTQALQMIGMPMRLRVTVEPIE